MSSVKKANPTVIGAFVLVALALVAFAVMVLGGAALFTPKQKVVSFFEGSVKGLTVGSPVNFRGVKVGSVDRIVLQFAAGSLEPRIPVYMTLLPNSVKLIGAEEDGSDIPFDAYIQKGLKAKLSIDSLVTGQLVVDLDFRPDVPTVFHGSRETSYPEIPSMKSDFDVLKDQLAQLPLRQLAEDVKGMVESFQVLAKGTGGTLGIVGEELKATAITTRQTLEEAQRTIKTLNSTLQSFERTSEEARKTLAASGPELEQTLRSARAAMARVETTMQGADAAVAQVSEMTAPGAPIRAELEQSLRDLSASAESLRQFADTVERQPNAVIFGKD
ncbi:MAG: MlaD family protein [Stagnimonas sp.]|nr:MlaD family protein [Stagnimonas sp.]